MFWRPILLFLPILTQASLLRGSTEEMTSWQTRDRTLFYRGNDVKIKGINFHGMETDCRVPHGLWKNSLTFYLDLLQENGFNAIRIPLAYEIMTKASPLDKNCISADHSLQDLDTDTFIHHFLDIAWERGITTVFDLHTIGGVITPYPWTNEVTEDDIINAWGIFAQKFAVHPGVMALEIKNEPHGDMTLDEYEKHCARVISHILEMTANKYQGLFFIGGVQIGHGPWGGAFGGGKELGITLEASGVLSRVSSRVVFTPHIYGPDVRGPSVQGEDGLDMEERFGFIWNLPNHWNQSVIIPTEFGGSMKPGSMDMVYFTMWKEYMFSKGMTTGAFFWTLPQTSGDTGGLIVGDEWRSLDANKLSFLELLQPEPTEFLAFK